MPTASDTPHLNVDLTTLRTLRLVYDLGSFSAAAQQLGQNQSTISYAIDRARQAFQDPLFARQGKGIAPTDRCREIVQHVGHMLDDFEVLATPRTFEPLEATETITLSCNYYERVIILPALVKKIRQEAPGLRLKVIQSRVKGDVQLKRGETDLLFSPMQVDGSEVFRRRVYEDYYVCVMDRNNPLAKAPFDLDSYRHANHVTITYDGRWRPLYLDALEANNVQLKSVIGLTSMSTLESLLVGTDLISTIPRSIAEKYGTDIVVRPCPVDVPLKINLFWTARSHHSAMHKWMRSLIAEPAWNNG